jgi:hypothetical protein
MLFLSVPNRLPFGFALRRVPQLYLRLPVLASRALRPDHGSRL